MKTLKVIEIACLTGFTRAHIRHECRMGLLPATLEAFARNRTRWLIAEADYEAWKNNPPRKRRKLKRHSKEAGNG